MNVAVNAIPFNLGEGCPRTRYSTPLVLTYVVVGDVAARVENYDTISVGKDFVLADPSEPTLNREDALAPAS